MVPCSFSSCRETTTLPCNDATDNEQPCCGVLAGKTSQPSTSLMQPRCQKQLQCCVKCRVLCKKTAHKVFAGECLVKTCLISILSTAMSCHHVDAVTHLQAVLSPLALPNLKNYVICLIIICSCTSAEMTTNVIWWIHYRLLSEHAERTPLGCNIVSTVFVQVGVQN